MRELHIFLYLHLYFSNSSLVEFQGRRRRKACPFLWPQRCHRRKEEKQTVFKHNCPSFPLLGFSSALALLVSGDTLTAAPKVTRKAVRLDLAQLGQTEAVLRFRLSEQLSGIEGLHDCPCWAKPFSLSPKLVGHQSSGPLAGARWKPRQKAMGLQLGMIRESQDGREQTVPPL